jgi:hypothetical protein
MPILEPERKMEDVGESVPEALKYGNCPVVPEKRVEVAAHAGTELPYISTFPYELAPNNVLVANEVTFAVFPVLLPRMYPAFICGSIE